MTAVKKGLWTDDEDAFLLTWEGIGADFVASHDLGRADGAGTARMRKLIASGAAEKFAQAQKLICEYRLLAGLCRSAFAQEATQDDAEQWEEKAGRWRLSREEQTA